MAVLIEAWYRLHTTFPNRKFVTAFEVKLKDCRSKKERLSMECPWSVGNTHRVAHRIYICPCDNQNADCRHDPPSGDTNLYVHT